MAAQSLSPRPERGNDQDLILSHPGGQLPGIGHGVGRLDGRDDALRAGEVLEGVHRLRVGDGDVLGPAGVMEHGVLRPDAGVVQAGGDGVDRGDLPVRVLTEVGLHAVEDAQLSGGDGGGGVRRVRPAPRRLTADEADGGIRDEVVEGADGVGAAPTQVSTASGGFPSFSSSCARISREMTAWKSPHYGGRGGAP